MHLNGEKWIRILIPLSTLLASTYCLRASELILLKAKQGDAKTNLTNTANEQVSEGEGGNSTTVEKSLLTGNPQIDYIHDPNLPRELNGYNLSSYPFYNAIPKGIEFKCDGLHDGFYASVPHYCQVYHHCLYGIRYDFLCANYTAFDQKTFICHFVSEVDCNNSPKYYKRNEALYKAVTTAPVVKTTKATEAPTTKKAEEDPPRRPGPYRHRRPPFRRRPAYEYYDNRDDYYDDYYYYEPPARKRPNRHKGFNRGESYYGGERAGGVKSIHREAPSRRKPLKPAYVDEEEEYDYYEDQEGTRDDDDRRRPVENNYKKPSDRERPYFKKRDKNYNRNTESGLRNDKKKKVEEDISNSRKTDDLDDDRRIGGKYSSKGSGRLKINREEEDDLDYNDNPRRYESRNEDDKRDKYQKNRNNNDTPKRTTVFEKPQRSKQGQRSTTTIPPEDEYDEIPVTPKWKSRFQQRRPNKDDNLKKSEFPPTAVATSSEEAADSRERTIHSNRGKEKNSNRDKPIQATEASVTVVSANPQIYARQPSRLYNQVKAETRPPPRQQQSELYKSDLPATTMSYRRPFNPRGGAKDKPTTEAPRPKTTTKPTTTSTQPISEEYEDDVTANDDLSLPKPIIGDYDEGSYEELPFRINPPQPTRTVKQPTLDFQSESQVRNGQRNKPVSTSFTQTFKPITTERQPVSYLKQQVVTERQPVVYQKQPVTDRQTILYQRQPLDEIQTLTYSRQQVTERQPFTPSKQVNERQTFSYAKQPVTERQTVAYPKQAVTERQQYYQQPFPRQPVTDRQVITYQKQIVTDRQINPYLKQQEERQPAPFPKQPPRTFEITAPGPSGLGGRIDASDSLPRNKYVIQGDRPTGFSLRLPQTAFGNPLTQQSYQQPTTQLQRRPEEPNLDRIVTRSPFKPVRNYRTKTTPTETQFHDGVRIDSYPQRYPTGSEREEYQPVVVTNSRLPVVPQIAHVSGPKEWYW